MRLYLTPMIGTGTAVNPNRCKYVAVNVKGVVINGLIKGRWSILTYGKARCCILGCTPTPVEHFQLTSNLDVYAFPADLDRPVTDASTLEAALNFYSIPCAWIQNGMPYREVLRRISGIFQMMQNMSGQGVKFGHLDAPFGMETKAQHFKHPEQLGTVREVLEKVSTEYQATPFNLKEEV